MAKKAGGKKDDEGEAYDFQMPAFDEKAFMRRELESARITFWTVGVALVVGFLAFALGRYGGDWRLGLVPIALALATLGPALKRLGYSEEQTGPKMMFGNWFLLFFTALAVWIIALNV